MAAIAEKRISSREALALFKGWFNNKMMIILIMAQYPLLRRKSCDVGNQLCFLHDIEHHYMRRQVNPKRFSNCIRWLRAFFRVYPDGITLERSKRAVKEIAQIYEAFGFPFYQSNWHQL